MTEGCAECDKENYPKGNPCPTCLGRYSNWWKPLSRLIDEVVMEAKNKRKIKKLRRGLVSAWIFDGKTIRKVKIWNI